MGISVKEIIVGLENGSIILDTKGHQTNSIVDSLTKRVELIEERIERAEKPHMKQVFKSFIEDIKIGIPIHDTHDNYCFSCGERNYLVLIDEKTLGFFNISDYYELKKIKGDDHILSQKDFTECKAASFVSAGKLTSTIHVPSGNLVFDNFFKTEELYDMKEEGYHSINDIMGRNDLMQHLASKNVGYGQLSNMSVEVYYSKEKSEILIGENDIEDRIYDLKSYIEESPGDVTDEDRETLKELEEIDLNVFDGFDHVGSICCDVWRWQCADKKTLDDAGDEQRDSAFTIKVSPGDWEIEHYFDFLKKESNIYSRIKLK